MTCEPPPTPATQDEHIVQVLDPLESHYISAAGNHT